MSGSKKGKGGKKGEGSVRPIIIKRQENVEGGHHGGAWKVAYADFVTAMMAFFLLMWLLNATTDAQKRGIADYFSPISAMSRGTSGTGRPFGGKTPFSEGAMVSDLGAESIMQQVKQTDDADDQNDPSHSQPRRTADAGEGAGAEDSENPGRGPTGEAMAGTAQAGNQASGKALSGASATPPSDGTAATQSGAIPLGGNQAVAAQKTAQDEATPENGKATADSASADAASAPPPNAASGAGAAAADQQQGPGAGSGAPMTAQQEHVAFQNAAQQIRQAVAQDPNLADVAKQMTIDETPDGLRIQLLDEEKRSMFQLGSSRFNDRARTLLQKVAPALEKLPEDIVITGHTDAAPFPGIGRTNWELSTERAMSTRLLLAQSGLADKRFRSVAGNADRDLLLPSDPLSPANRRIAIVLLRSAPGGSARASQPLTPEGAAAAGAALVRGGNKPPAGQSLQLTNPTAPPAASPTRPIGAGAQSAPLSAAPPSSVAPPARTGAGVVPSTAPATPTTR